MGFTVGRVLAVTSIGTMLVACGGGADVVDAAACREVRRFDAANPTATPSDEAFAAFYARLAELVPDANVDAARFLAELSADPRERTRTDVLRVQAAQTEIWDLIRGCVDPTS